MANSVKVNFLFLSINNIFNIIFPIITIPYITRVLLPEDFGKIAMVVTLTSLFVILSSLGIPTYAIREVSLLKKEKNKLIELINELFRINLLSTMIFFVLYLIIINIVPSFKENINFYYYGSIIILLSSFNIEWIYKGLENYKFISIRSGIIKIISLFLMLIFVKTHEDSIKYLYILIFAQTGNFLLTFISAIKGRLFTYKKIEIKSLKKHIKSVLYFLTSRIMSVIYTTLDTLMLGIISGDKYVALYNISIKLNKILLSFIGSLNNVLFPRLSYYLEEKDIELYNKMLRKAFKIILYLSIPTFFGLGLYSRFILNLFVGSQYNGAVITMRVISPVIVIISIGGLTGLQVLCANKAEKEFSQSLFMGALVNLILNLILIPKYNHLGAAIATLAAEITIVGLQSLFAYKKLNINILNFLELKIIIISSMWMVGSYFIYSIFPKSIFASILGIIISILLYLILLISFREEIIIDILVKKKLMKKIS